jgi:hypothetical protein
MRELAFEFSSEVRDYVDRLEGEMWDRLYDRVGEELADELVDAKIDKLIEDTVCEGYILIPLHLYDHSGLTISTRPFGCIFDSGQVGWIICDNETIEREFKGDRALAGKCLRAEVEVYDDYLTNNVYGFIIEDENGEHIDSCWGFYGSDPRTNGMADYLSEEELELAELSEAPFGPL